MNTDELIVMGVLMILAGGLMVARHFAHTMEIPAPMATRKARKTTGNATSPAAVQKALAVGDQQMNHLLARIGKLEERHHYHVERQVLDYEALERRIAKLEDLDYEALKRRIAKLED